MLLLERVAAAAYMPRQFSDAKQRQRDD